MTWQSIDPILIKENWTEIPFIRLHLDANFGIEQAGAEHEQIHKLSQITDVVAGVGGGRFNGRMQ
jgi:hypothetical protein